MKVARSKEDLEQNKSEWDKIREFLRRHVEDAFLMGQQGSVIVYRCKKCGHGDYFNLNINPFAIDSIVSIFIDEIKSRETAYAIALAQEYIQSHGD